MPRPLVQAIAGPLFKAQLNAALEYESGIGETFETVSGNLDASGATYAYTDGNLTSVVYANGVTKTLAYSGGDLVTVTLSGATPDGISLVKTYTYTGGDLTGHAYS